MVQTGPKTELGGLKKGFSSVEYQDSIARKVKYDPIPPAINGRAREITSLMNLFTI